MSSFQPPSRTETPRIRTFVPDRCLFRIARAIRFNGAMAGMRGSHPPVWRPLLRFEFVRRRIGASPDRVREKSSHEVWPYEQDKKQADA
jgi:hypothetical protein